MRDAPIPVPAAASEVTLEWLRLALAGNPIVGNATSLRVERIGEGFGLASLMLRCHLQGQAGTHTLVAKLWSAEEAGGTRELPFYQQFAPRLGIRAPAMHFGALDESRGRAVLLLEDLRDAVQGDCMVLVEGDAARQLAALLATLHAAWWERAELDSAVWLPTVPERSPGWHRERSAQFLERFGDVASPELRALVERAEVLGGRARERLAGAAGTLLHGDLHLDNVLFMGAPRQPVLLDWARVARGPAVHDLAEMLFAMVTPAVRDETLECYLAELAARGVGAEPRRAVHGQLAGAWIRKLLRGTCGIAGWHPRLDRERQLLELTLRQSESAIAHWELREPGLLGP